MAAKKRVTDQYRGHLTKVGKSPHMVRAYAHDLAAFARWFEQTAGEDFDPQAVDPRDIQELKRQWSFYRRAFEEGLRK